MESNKHPKMTAAIAAATTVSCGKITFWTLTAVALQITGLSLFVLGFFPVKPAFPGVSGPESYSPPGNESIEDYNVTAMSPHQLRSLYQEMSEIPPAYARLILMVVDGLPAEFVLGKDDKPPSRAFVDAMPYTQSLLANRMAIAYHAKAAPPTVTMPRLKAMVSGAIGGFLDVAFNFNTQAFLDDNLLGQLFRIGWKMGMFGDETWLKLFPQVFTWQDGVSSFFVKDTVQVDLNVSRHLPEELSKDVWDLLIFHYLGVDHVGHIGGRNSVLMAPKLREMDDVIKKIHLNSILSPHSKQGETLLLVVSDHGMTDSGNHGGSSYEETDALAMFIGPNSNFHKEGVSAAYQNSVMQVDIPPTLALLLGVPIPKNNVGIIAMDCFQGLTDGQELRALEINSWQLMRLLKAQLPHLSCVNSVYGNSIDGKWVEASQCDGTIEEMFCCLYSKAADFHNAWRNTASRANGGHHHNRTITAYHDFLKTASDWLTRRVTHKPFGQLAFGILAMVLSCLALLRLLYCLQKEDDLRQKQWLLSVKNGMRNLTLEEIYIVSVIVILVVSMGSSSMVEEEQYIWHFMTSTLFWILLRSAMKGFLVGDPSEANMSNYKSSFLQVCSLLLILISGRIMRAWHQGGVNWTHLPDISKWLEQPGNNWVNITRVLSGIAVTSLSIFVLSRSRVNRRSILPLQLLFLVSGYLVLQHAMKYQDNLYEASGPDATFTAQLIFMILSAAICFAVIASPWLTPLIFDRESCPHCQTSGPILNKDQIIHLLVSFKESFYLIGWVYMLSWSLLQLLLQQPVNSGPVVLLLLQISACMTYFFNDGALHKAWVVVVTLYFMGMAGHFALGNSNTLATIDVAGAFIGISSHSTLLSGILMFCITYGSPMLVLLSLVLYISLKDYRCLGADDPIEFGLVRKSLLAIPLLVPLGINSVLLVAYTVVLLQMRNHLFIWSVFSPKYLYVCATTICIYIGVFIVAATESYISLVFTLRRRRLHAVHSAKND